MEKNLSVLSVLILCFAVVACASPPYVHIQNEFNRSLHGFSQESEDITEVTVCYSSSNTTNRDVMKLASDRCALFGKKAVFETQDYQTCPLSTPVAAQYVCVAPDKP